MFMSILVVGIAGQNTQADAQTLSQRFDEESETGRASVDSGNRDQFRHAAMRAELELISDLQGEPRLFPEESNNSTRAHDFDFVFGIDSEAYGRRVKRLRIAGWSMLSMGLTLGIVGPIVSILANYRGLFEPPSQDRWYGIVTTVSVGGAAFITGAICLLTARIKVGHRRHFRRWLHDRYPEYDAAAIDVGFGPDRVSFGVPF